MGEAAVAAARGAGYRNAGTIEFLVEGHGDTASFYFLEMNTRLQVEHPVTELVTGTDLVHAQLQVAAGGPLPWTQADLSQRGHAIECRVYAEDPAGGFLPQAGTLRLYREPSGPGIRIDSGVVEGGEVPVQYDPMLAKLIASAPSRDAAIARAVAALRDFPILGVRTNIGFLINVLEHPRFRAGDVHTGFIDEHLDALLKRPEADAIVQAAAALARRQPSVAPLPAASTAHRPRTPGRISRPGDADAGCRSRTATRRVDRQERRRAWSRLYAVSSGPTTWVFRNGFVYEITEATATRKRAGAHESLTAPMPATVIQINVAAGAEVKRGDVLLLLEAMKMELPLRAPADGRVIAVQCAAGQLVQSGATLIELE